MRRRKKLQTATKKSSGHDPAQQLRQPAVDGLARCTSRRCASSSSVSFGSSIRVVVKRWPLLSFVGARLERAADGLLADDHLGDLAVLEQRLELAVGNRAARGAPTRYACDHDEQEQEGQDVPHRNAPGAGRRPTAAGRRALTRRRSWVSSQPCATVPNRAVGRRHHEPALAARFSKTSPSRARVHQRSRRLRRSRPRARASRAGRAPAAGSSA